MSLKNLPPETLAERYWALRTKMHRGTTLTNRAISTLIRRIDYTATIARERGIELGAP